MVQKLFLSLFLLFAMMTPAKAEVIQRNSEARLFSSVEGVGHLAAVPVGLEINLNTGWKTYWRTPGEAGLAPVLDWAGSENLKDVTMRWPAPSRFEAFDIDNFGYHDAVTFPLDMTLKDPNKPLSLKLKLDLLVCADICVPEQHNLTLYIPAREAQINKDQPKLAAAEKTIPNKLDTEQFSIQNLRVGKNPTGQIELIVTAATPLAPSPAADLFVEAPAFVSVGKPGIQYDNATKTATLTAPIRSTDTLESLQKTFTTGVTTLTVTDGSRSFERSFGTSVSPLEKITTTDISFNILLFAFLGGLILNLMPCVLPVLSLKVLSVLSHGGKDHRIHRWNVFRNFMASALGILVSFWVMAVALISLKASGESIGWGIQFQHPAFLIFLITVLILFAINMWGFFEIPLPRFIAKHASYKDSLDHDHEPTLLGHFLTGAFATLLATPCTAPFLGTAVGFALARESADILIIFTFIGLGLALPYLLLAVSPRIFKYMPRPGQWMVTLKKILAFALLLTAAWLINVLVTISTQATLDTGWTKFDETLIAPAVENGQTVVVDVTADWCLTCKANKRLVLDQKEIVNALSQPNVLRLQADWTHRDEAIATYLRKYGRYGIPFNIIYGPSAPNGIILNELLSKQEVLRALTDATGE